MSQSRDSGENAKGRRAHGYQRKPNRQQVGAAEPCNCAPARQLNRYAQTQGMQVAQLAACNRLHEVEQRLARWLLMTQDRVGSDVLPITHDFLAQMLGTGRPTVSVAAGVLQRGGMIEYMRGTIKILDRKKLERSEEHTSELQS